MAGEKRLLGFLDDSMINTLDQNIFEVFDVIIYFS